MKTAVLLAPGPSLTRAVADAAEADIVGVINNAYELRPDATFLAANDRKWWLKNAGAQLFAGRKFSFNDVPGVERLPGGVGEFNSGVLALQVAADMGAERIELYGFDMHGSHFFGTYSNGLNNTTPERREVHQRQYVEWRRRNPGVVVVNRTPGSRLRAFPYRGEA